MNTPIQLTFLDCGPQAEPDAILATSYDGLYGLVRGWTTPNPRLNNLDLRSPDPDPDDLGRFSACGNGAGGGGEPVLVDLRGPN